MSWLRILLNRVRQLPRRRDAEAEVDEEFAFHLSMEEERLRAGGLSAAEARRRARVSFGGVERHREAMREGREVMIVETVIRDLHHGVRGLRRAPAFTGAAVLTLSLGLGAATAVFAVADAVLLRPLPFPDADRIQTLWTDYGDGSTLGLTEPEALELPGRVHGMELGVWSTGPFNLVGGDEPRQARGVAATAGLFDVLGTEPVLGRVFTASEDRPGNDGVVVLGESLWRERFGADPGVLGTAVDVDGRLRTVIGVVASGHDYPDPSVRLWVPLAIDPAAPDLSSRYLRTAVLLDRGMDPSVVEEELDRIAGVLADEIPVRYGSRNNADGFNLVPLRDVVTGDVRSILLLLLGGVGVVLLIGCANVGNLMLARQEARRHELAVRAALGGARVRLLAFALSESLLISVTAAVLSALLAWVSVRAFVALAPAEFPRLSEVGVSGAALAFTAGAALVAGVTFGLVAVMALDRRPAGETLLRRGRGGTVGLTARRFRRALVVSQLALTLALLAGSGLLLRTLSALARQSLGITAEHAVEGRLFLPEGAYPSTSDVQAFVRALERAASAVPGVQAAGLVTALPMSGGYSIVGWKLPGVEVDPDAPLPQANHVTVTPGYLDALGIPLLDGRNLTDEDVSGPRAVLVSESFADVAWSGQPAVGRRIHLGGPDSLLHTVVGVVGDVLHHGPGQPAPPTVYFPLRRYPWGDLARGFHLVLRTEADGTAAVAAVRDTLRRLDPRTPLADLRSVSSVVAASTARPRLAAFLLTSFAMVGLLIAAAGVYGVFAYTVSRRVREMGIRIALGSAPGRVQRIVLGEAAALVATGAAGGALVYAGSASLVRRLLYDVAPSDPVALTAALGLLLLVALAASWGPALRASRVDPTVCLRHE